MQNYCTRRYVTHIQQNVNLDVQKESFQLSIEFVVQIVTRQITKCKLFLTKYTEHFFKL